MPPDSAWSQQFKKSEAKLNFTELGWKNLMSKCLMETEIFKKNENEREKCLCFDLNSVMDARHRMVRESTRTFSMPQLQIHTEALKLIRMKNHEKLLKQKESKMIEKEISRLKQTLENQRLLVQKKLHETTEKKVKPTLNKQKYAKNYTKLCKRFESFDGVCEVDTWVSRSLQMTMETKLNEQGIPIDVKVSVKRQNEQEEFPEPISTRKGSLADGDTECEKEFLGVFEGENEIMKRFLENCAEEVNKELPSSPKQNKDIRLELREIENRVNLRRLKHAWLTWKLHTQQYKHRKKEKTIRRSKIETFLSKLQEKELRKQKSRKLKTTINGKHVIKIHYPLNLKEKFEKQQEIKEEKEKQLKQILREAKASQMETYQKLQEIQQAKIKNQENAANLKFLERMNQRQEERLKRWREIKEKKQKLEEERKKAQQLKEHEKRQAEEEHKRKRLEELKERRRLEKEKLHKEKEEREKLQRNTELAESHYVKYLLHSYGLRPWLALLSLRHSQEEKASAFFERRMTQKLFLTWLSHVREQMAIKNKRADEFYEKKLMKNHFLLWLNHHQEKMLQCQAAVDWNEFKIMERAFKKWLKFTEDEQLEYLNKKEKAELYHERMLKRKHLRKLRDYPEFKKLEQAKENRKQKWRQKVMEILPDYQPVDLFEDLFTFSVQTATPFYLQ